jgi:RNA polymerase sigma-70 factor (ECF subfamily)
MKLMPDEPEAQGLLALMLLQGSRRSARVDAEGGLLTLEEQDRGLWDGVTIAEGVEILDAAMRFRRPGAYQVQAAIAACHATAADSSSTDWPEIVALYGELSRWAVSPVVELNRAVAVAMAEGPAVGLGLVDALAESGSLSGYYLLPATQADLLRRLGRVAEAAAAYRAALAFVGTDTERRYLIRRLEQLSSSG